MIASHIFLVFFTLFGVIIFLLHHIYAVLEPIQFKTISQVKLTVCIVLTHIWFNRLKRQEC